MQCGSFDRANSIQNLIVWTDDVKEATVSNQQAVSISKAMWRGFLGRCPNCGEGRLFGRFLKVKDACEACGEEFHHHRADDFPAYLVIVVVGHIIVPLVLSVETHYAPPYWVHLALWLPLTLGLSLGLLQPTKGLVVALQWFAGMHGFEAAKLKREAAAAHQSVTA
jgi:uncharacterized protein (DUF983 family)